MSTRYRVYITPRTDLHMYGEEIDVSDLVLYDGIGKITKSIDSTDYAIGVFVFSDLSLKCQNQNGYFNEESDGRSIFKFSRDLAKVRVVFMNSAGDTINFSGLINEAATKLNTETETIEFKVLSYDSVLRTTNIPAGTVSDGMTCQAALMAILNQASIISVLNVDNSHLNPTYNFNIDVGTEFDDQAVSDMLNQLLIASNSCMIIDSSFNVIVQSRAANSSGSILTLFGPYDLYRRQNTIKMTDYNTGKQRMFNSFMINNSVRENSAYAQQYGFNQDQRTFSFLTETGTTEVIAQTLVNEFAYPKLECQVDIPSYVAPNVSLLDQVSLNWPLYIKPAANKFFPVIGVTAIGDSSEPLPLVYGTIAISPNIAWKVIQITDDPVNFIKTLKLRQQGTSISDGYYTATGSNRIDFAVIGNASIGGQGTVSYNPSIVGAAQIDNTMVA